MSSAPYCHVNAVVDPSTEETGRCFLVAHWLASEAKLRLGSLRDTVSKNKVEKRPRELAQDHPLTSSHKHKELNCASQQREKFLVVLVIPFVWNKSVVSSMP